MLNSIAISSRIRLARNISGLPFPNKLSDIESSSGVSKAIFDILGEDYSFRKLKNLNNLQCLKLLESRIITKELIDNKDISSYAISPDEKIIVMINEEDHIKEQCTIDGLDLEKCYERLSRIDNAILNKLDIAFSSEFGFLTACPTNIGTAMKVSVLLFLPALTLNGAISSLIETLNQNGLLVKDYFTEGNNQDFFYTISNKYTLGISEQEIIELVNKNVKRIIEMEEIARESLKKSQRDVIIDMAYRAYGILTNSYLLASDECIEQLSKLRFANVCGLVKIRNSKVVDELYTTIQSAHLMDYYSIELSEKEQYKFRAKFVSESLANILVKGV